MKKELVVENLLLFFIEIEKLKAVMRHSYTSNATRQESSAEHSWMMSIIAITLFQHLDRKVDQLKVLKLVLIHDLAEIITSDIPAFEVSERQTNKKAAEKKAFDLLTMNLEPETKTEFLSLFEEFEEYKTVEAQIAQAIDKMEVIIQHNIADIATWDQGDFDLHPFYRDNFFDFDSFMRTLRDRVEVMSRKKISTHNALDKLKPEFKKIYEELNKNDL